MKELLLLLKTLCERGEELKGGFIILKRKEGAERKLVKIPWSYRPCLIHLLHAVDRSPRNITLNHSFPPARL
jgi:hypothetical protein